MKMWFYVLSHICLIIGFSNCSTSKHLMPVTKLNLGVIPAPNTIFPKASTSNISKINLPLSLYDQCQFVSTMIVDENKLRWTSDASANVIVTYLYHLENEAYRLDIQKERIIIGTNSQSGLQYAITSLIQMIQYHVGNLPQVIIEDGPKYKYRGMHLDVARHFFSVEEVKSYLDYMAYYKFNYFHWHLTDDQGWRIEIKRFPKLQEIAAYRKETLIGHYNDQPHKFDGKRYGGYYTQEQINEIVAYAALRNIQVIPEIEMPGHALAALAAYPDLGCGSTSYEVATKWGVFEEVFCPYEETFRFLYGVIDEIVELFPCKYIHIGGDECPKVLWKKNEYCLELMRKESLTNADELQSYFIKRIEKYINSKGKQIIGWDEILEGGLAPNATVMSWRGIEGGLEAAQKGHDVIMTPGSHCYFDHYQSDHPSEPLAIGGLTTLEKVYSWNPLPNTLDKDKAHHILGGQANVWTEYIKSYPHIEYMAYSRGMAMSEVLWSHQKNYEAFVPRFIDHYYHWRAKGANLAIHIFDLRPRIIAGQGKAIELQFDMMENAEIVATPINNIKRKSPNTFVINNSGTYTFYQKTKTEQGRPYTLIFDLHQGTNAKISLDKVPHQNYPGQGPGSLINGILGSDDKYSGNEWLGFYGTDCSGIITFEDTTTINQVSFRLFKGEGQWIYLPKKIILSSSNNGVDFDTVREITEFSAPDKICTVDVVLDQVQSKYLKFEIKNFGIIPENSQGAGHHSWLFVDEIIVR